MVKKLTSYIYWKFLKIYDNAHTIYFLIRILSMLIEKNK